MGITNKSSYEDMVNYVASNTHGWGEVKLEYKQIIESKLPKSNKTIHEFFQDVQNKYSQIYKKENV